MDGEGGEGEEEDDERMNMGGQINFPNEPLPLRQGDADDSAPKIEMNDADDDPVEEDDEKYMQDIIAQ